MARKAKFEVEQQTATSGVTPHLMASTTRFGEVFGSIRSEERPFIELALCLAYLAVIVGRDPWMCFGFALVVIAINIGWIERKKSRRE